MTKLGHRCRRAGAWLAMAAVAALGGCASDVLSPDAGWFSKPIDVFSRPNWSFYSDGRVTAKLQLVGPGDLVAADGSCAGEQAVPTVSSAEVSPSLGNESDMASRGTLVAGIGLDMTECEVVRRAGRTGSVDISTNPRGERTVALTYLSGPSPGIYRFTSGRLTSMEWVAEPEPAAKPRTPAKSTRPAQTRTRT